MSSKKFSEIADQNVFDKLRLGVTNLPLGNAKISNSLTSQNIFNKNLKKNICWIKVNLKLVKMK